MSDRLAFSQVGHEPVADTDVHSGLYYGFIVMADTVINAITYAEHFAATDDDLADFTSIPKGTTIFADFTSIDLTSGEVLLLLK